VRRARAAALRLGCAAALGLGAGGAAIGFGCASGGAQGDYLRYSAHDTGFEHVVLRWEARKMPLRVHLPPPPPGLASDPEAALDAVRDGFTDWTDVAAPGVPSFVFVESAGDADIPVVWEREPTGDWFIAYCVMEPNLGPDRFRVARILVTTRYQGREATLEELYQTMLHEVGHGIGLGHSPVPGDIMFPRSGTARGPSPRDRATLRRLYELPIGHPVSGARSVD
jgi:hypothetical protein